MTKSSPPPPMGILGSFLIYLPASAALVLATTYLIPFLSELTGYETVL